MLRRISQILFFSLFLFLLFKTEFRGSFGDTGAATNDLGYPVKIFLEMDPLISVSTAISAHSLYKGLLWSLIIIAGTFIIGRFFCGWICPLGALNQFLSIYKPERKGRKRVDANRYKKLMSTKYYLLFGLIVMSIFTSVQTGLIDPIPFLVRSLSVSVLPAANVALSQELDYLYRTDVGVLKAVSETGYYIFGSSLLSYQPHYFHYGWLIGGIFLLVIILNRFVTRFWCRYICPLGALLGIMSRFSIFGLHKDHDKCDDCNQCLINCQGACEPQGGVKWRQAECHLCFNCEVQCPQDALKFKFFPDKESVDIEPDLKKPVRTSSA